MTDTKGYSAINQYIKSPMNYMGNKYKLLDDLYTYFPKDCSLFVDLFAGGCDVSINLSYNNVSIIANDINNYIINFYKSLQNINPNEYLKYIDQRINEFGLSKTNKEAFLNFRKHYNATKNPLDLFILKMYSFSMQIRFNNNQEYNSSFGYQKGGFNDNLRRNLIKFAEKIKPIKFFKQDFKDFDYSLLDNYSNCFVYADPPYSLGCATYNDGKRGFKGWHSSDDIMLFGILDGLSSKGIKFALSNVIEHKGQTNELLVNWIKANDYNLIPINYNYDNCNYQAKNKNYTTKEVLITNY